MSISRRRFIYAALLCGCVFFPTLGGVQAQFDNGAIARLYNVTGTAPISGDLVSFNRASQTFSLSVAANDPNLFGVMVSNPVLVLQSPGGGVPIVSTGEVLVNVTTLAGPIVPGDQITSSGIPGKGQKASGSGGIVLGTALDAFRGATTTRPVAATTTVYEGSVRVLLNIGPRASDAPVPQQTVVPIAASAPTSPIIAKVLKYLLAAAVAVGSVAGAFRNFGTSIRDGIVSVGRNPLAKSSIQSMVILNSVLIILVSAGGLFVAFAILLLPL